MEPGYAQKVVAVARQQATLTAFLELQFQRNEHA